MEFELGVNPDKQVLKIITLCIVPEYRIALKQTLLGFPTYTSK